MALLLILLLPLGLFHRSSTGACQDDRHGTAVVSAGAASDAAFDAPSATAAGPHARAVIADPHDHQASDLPLHGAAPGACGPAALAESPAGTNVSPSRAAPPSWRGVSPLALAAPPPAPPPRLG